MSSNNGNGKTNGNGRGGPPPWADNGRGRHVDTSGDSPTHVGKEPADEARDRAQNATDQMDRIEAKVDWIISQMEGSP